LVDEDVMVDLMRVSIIFDLFSTTGSWELFTKRQYDFSIASISLLFTTSVTMMIQSSPSFIRQVVCAPPVTIINPDCIPCFVQRR
jgi:hypothetical protein